uniref:Uncharacterized protein n=1 Tax=Meloidogyne javanica TaxID=6303 RepID=A0A915LSK6_MELJA
MPINVKSDKMPIEKMPQGEFLCSEEQFETYLREAGKSIRDCEECCSCWALKYDGSLPKSLMCNPQKLINSEGMILTPRQAFTRHSSARSSFASTGWNRYGHSNRSGRGTLLEGELESNNTNLNSLGEDDEQLTNLIERLEDGNEVINNLSSQEEYGEASVLNENEDNRPDYFQFIYDRISESDLDNLSLIYARWQHLEELRIEKLELTQQMSKEPNPFRLNLEGDSGGGEEVFLNINGGILMKSTEEKGF